MEKKQDSFLYSEWTSCSPLGLQDRLRLLWRGNQQEASVCLSRLQELGFDSPHWLFQLWKGRLLYLSDCDQEAIALFLSWRDSTELQANIWANVLLMQYYHFYHNFDQSIPCIQNVHSNLQLWKIEKNEIPLAWISGIVLMYFRGVRKSCFDIVQWIADQNIRILPEDVTAFGMVFYREKQQERAIQYWNLAREHPDLDISEKWLAGFHLLHEKSDILAHIQQALSDEMEPWVLAQTLKRLIELEAIAEGEIVAKHILSKDIDDDLVVFTKVNYIALLFHEGNLQKALELRHSFSWLDIDDTETQTICLLNDMFLCARMGLIEEFEERIEGIIESIRKVGDTSQIVVALINAVKWLEPSEIVENYVVELISYLDDIPSTLALHVFRVLIVYAERIEDMKWKASLLQALEELALEYQHDFSLFVARLWRLEHQLFLDEIDFTEWHRQIRKLKKTVQGKDVAYGMLLLNIAPKIANLGDKREAFQYFQEAKKLFERLGLPKDRMIALEGMADCAKGEQRIQYLQQLLEEELSIAQLGSSDYSRGSSLLRLRPIADELIQSFFDIGAVEKAIEIVFQLKMETGVSKSTNTGKNRLQPEKALPKILQQFPTNKEPISLAEVQKKISKETVVFEYYLLAEESLCIFVITKRAVDIVKVTINDEHFEMLDIVDDVASGQLFDGNEVYLDHVLRSLYVLLITPIEDRIVHYAEVFFAVGGFLSSCPFGALRSEEAYLIEKTDFSLLITGGQLIQLERRKESRYVASLLGDSVETPLRKSQSEQDDIHNLYQRYGYSLARTTEELSLAHIVHYAGHGWLEKEQGRNWIQIQEQKITVEQLSGWHFSAHPLVILVSCYSGRGYPLHDGFSGFIRTAFLSGASALVGADWEVSDEVGHQFAVQFLEKVLQGIKTAEAFQQVVLDIKTRYPHPFFWASFRLFGC